MSELIIQSVMKVFVDRIAPDTGSVKYIYSRLYDCTPSPAADSGRYAGLFPTIARINHSCRPNVVWGQRGKDPMAKEVRVTRR